MTKEKVVVSTSTRVETTSTLYLSTADIEQLIREKFELDEGFRFLWDVQRSSWDHDDVEPVGLTATKVETRYE